MKLDTKFEETMMCVAPLKDNQKFMERMETWTDVCQQVYHPYPICGIKKSLYIYYRLISKSPTFGTLFV